MVIHCLINYGSGAFHSVTGASFINGQKPIQIGNIMYVVELKKIVEYYIYCIHTITDAIK